MLRKQRERQMTGRDGRGEKGEGEDDLFSVTFVRPWLIWVSKQLLVWLLK